MSQLPLNRAATGGSGTYVWLRRGRNRSRQLVEIDARLQALCRTQQLVPAQLVA